MKTQIHPETGATLHRDRRRKTVHFGGLSKTVDVEGWYPDGDGDSIHTGAELAPVEAALRELKEQFPDHIRASRKRWKLTQEQAGAILGGGKRAFQKYETGQAVPTYAAIALIELVNASPENLEILKRLRGFSTSIEDSKGSSRSDHSKQKRHKEDCLAASH
jgi:HTH-type transcriptional regulator/antitoxin MqsA